MTIQVVTANTTVQNATADETFSSGLEELRLRQQFPDNQYSGDAFVELYEATAAGQTILGLARAGLSNIPAGATIVDAKLWVYVYTNGSFTTNIMYDVRARALLRNWVLAQATWNNWSTGNAWTSGGARSNGNDRDDSITGVGAFGTTNNAWYSIDVTDFVQAVVDGNITNYGVQLELVDPGDPDFSWRIFRDSTGTDGQRPEWVIEYTESSGFNPSRAINSNQVIQ